MSNGSAKETRTQEPPYKIVRAWANGTDSFVGHYANFLTACEDADFYARDSPGATFYVRATKDGMPLYVAEVA